jgi:hypothetical protein
MPETEVLFPNGVAVSNRMLFAVVGVFLPPGP